MEVAALAAGFSPVILANSRVRFRKAGRAAEGTAFPFSLIRIYGENPSLRLEKFPCPIR
jgi:hypothetical protein